MQIKQIKIQKVKSKGVKWIEYTAFKWEDEWKWIKQLK